MRLPICVWILLLGFVSGLLAQEPVARAPAVVQVMVLGTYHFGNPGQDLHNLKVDSVLTPAKQRELEEVAMRLAKFKPIKIAVEALSNRPDLALNKFDEFSPDKLNTNPDERVQIAFRLARLLGHKTVYGIDEQSDSVDYFPFGKVEAFAKENAQTERLTELRDRVDRKMKTMEAAQRVKSVRLMLSDLNEPDAIQADHRDFYYPLLRFGNQKEQPGADLNAAWYQRNAKIFAKLSQISQPADRVLIVFGSGHSFWLRHFVQNTPGFELVESNDYLR